MATINNEIDIFNHLLSAGRQKAVEVESEIEFSKGLLDLGKVLFRVEMKPLFGGKAVMFSYMLTEVIVLIEDLNDGNLRLSYDVVNDHEAKMKS